MTFFHKTFKCKCTLRDGLNGQYPTREDLTRHCYASGDFYHRLLGEYLIDLYNDKPDRLDDFATSFGYKKLTNVKEIEIDNNRADRVSGEMPIDNDNKEKGVVQAHIVSDNKGDENNGDAVERGVNKNNIDDNNNNGEGVARDYQRTKIIGENNIFFGFVYI